MCTTLIGFKDETGGRVDICVISKGTLWGDGGEEGRGGDFMKKRVSRGLPVDAPADREWRL